MAKRVHLIGNAHLDPIWQWTWQEGYAEIKATYRSALDRISQFDEFVFTCAGASTYQWVEENCPEMFEEIRQRVREGRWRIVGGWWLQPDCNLPSGESLARHSLYAQRYFLEKFGVMAKTGYNVDSFGHNQMIPQILQKSGMENYVFMRPFPSEKALPYSLFWWESPDGSQVLTYRLPVTYCTRDNTPEGLKNHLNACCDEVAGFQDVDMMAFYGVGNHGGGPTIQTIRILREMQASFEKGQLEFSHPDAYFDSIRRQDLQLPVVTEDLQHHASGCYSALSEIKKKNRQAENRLTEAEKLSVLANRLTGLAYPMEKFRTAWEDVMFCQFHDTLAGTAVKSGYEDVYHFLGEAMAISSKASNAAAQKISWAIDTVDGQPFPLSKDGDWAVWEQERLGTPLVVFNPNGFDVEEYVRVNKPITAVTDQQGTPVPMQRVRAACSNGDRTAIDKEGLFLARVPALGYRVYRVFMQREPEGSAGDRRLRAEENRLENDWFVLELDRENGRIQSLFDKRTGRMALIPGGNRALVVDDRAADTWSHGITVFDQVIGEFSQGDLTMVDRGELAATVRAVSRYGKSTLVQEFTLYRDLPDIDVRVRLDWQEEDALLKLSFDAGLADARAAYEIPFGYIEKPANAEEEPALQWAAVMGEDGALGVATDAKYSFSVSQSQLRMTAVRSPAYCYQGDYRDALSERTDMGIQEFSYSLVPQPVFDPAEMTRRAARLNNRLYTVMETFHTGTLPLEYRGMEIDRDNILLSACKAAEDGDGVVFRFYEAAGKETRAELRLPLAGADISARFAPFEIKTYHVGADGTVRETNLLEFSE